MLLLLTKENRLTLKIQRNNAIMLILFHLSFYLLRVKRNCFIPTENYFLIYDI